MKAKLFVVFFMLGVELLSQVGIGTPTPQGQLDIVSSTTGVVVPRVVNIENVRTPDGDLAVDGTVVYDLAREAICYRISGSWVCVSIDGSGVADMSVVDLIYNGISNYVKASNTGSQNYFGTSVVISEDGMYLAVGASRENSSSIGINGSESNTGANDSGAVYIYHKVGGIWVQEAFVKASNTGAGDRFGADLAISSDGSKLVVGAKFEGSDATGIGGAQNNDNAPSSGAVYVFSRNGSIWIQDAYIKSSNSEADDQFGYSVSISSDGSRIVVSSIGEDSNATGINGDQTDNSISDSGAVYCFELSGGMWSQSAYFKSTATNTYGAFGESVSISGSGSKIAVGAIKDDYGSYNDNGAVYIFKEVGGTWSQEDIIYGYGDHSYQFGNSVCLTSNGGRIAIGASGDDSDSEGINGAKSKSGSNNSGAAYIYNYSGGVWSEEVYIKASNPDTGDEFGNSVSISSDGLRLAVGAFHEKSNSIGLGGDQSDNSNTNAGAVYVFERSGSSWSQKSYIKSSNNDSFDFFGSDVSLTSNGVVLVVSAPNEDSNATGVNGDQSNNSKQNSGAVYIVE